MKGAGTMKKTQEIIGLPVFSVLDGKKIGQVKDLVINPEEGKVDFILVSNRNWYDGARVLGYKSVMGIGEHAVTTESENLLTTINETANANKLLERHIELKGNRVLTNRGNLIGVISEYIVDEDTGAIACLEFRTAEDESKIEIIDAKQVMTYGVDVIVIKQEESPEVSLQQKAVEAEKLVSPVAVTSVTSPEPTSLVAPASSPPAGSSDGAAFFKQKQRQFLLGKRLIQDIKDAIGNVLIAQETVITEEILDLAERNNRFIELTQCAR
jgi:uncharacterized protein YrrD